MGRIDPETYPVLPNKRMASYCGSASEWERLASEFEQSGEKRIAETIRAGIKRQHRKADGWYTRDRTRINPTGVYCLRFRGGSIDKMDAKTKGATNV